MRGGIVGVYNRANYLPRLIALAERYGQFLDALLRTTTAEMGRLMFQPSHISTDHMDEPIH
jgi:hypothetical protein